MTDTVTSLATKLEERFQDQVIDCVKDRNEVTLIISAENIISVATSLRDESEFRFEQLSDLCGMDYLSFGDSDWVTRETTATGFSRGRDIVKKQTEELSQRFAVVYHLLSITNNMRLRVRCYVDSEAPRIDSVTSIWSGADWYEREAFDLYGILFDGHPDLRRLLTDYGFIGHPFRKDFPLEGNVEVRYDPDKKRVIYQPVSITNRVLVPKVIRDDNRYVSADEEQSDA
ncbi:MAG: NADH-quinone oxidoreductase subunit C [Pseudomonadota bacterium]